MKGHAATLSEDIALFRQSVDKFAGLLAGKDIQVVFRGGECRTDGNMVVLPALETLEGLRGEANLAAAQQFVANMVGYVNHEVAHVLFTDFDAWGGMDFHSKQVQALANVIEDARVEHCMARLWRGTRSNMDAYAQQALEGHGESWRSKDHYAQLCMLFSLMLRGADFERFDALFDPKLAAWARSMLRPYAEKMRGLQDTTAACNLAREVSRAIRQAFKEPPPPPPSDEQAEDAEEEPRPQEDDAEAEEDSEEDSDEDAQAQERPSLADSDDGSAEGDNATQADQLTDKAHAMQDRFAKLAQAVSPGNRPYAIYTTEGDQVGPMVREGHPHWRAYHEQFNVWPDMDVQCAEVAKLTDRLVGPLRNALTRVLRARGMAYTVRDLEHGALDRRRLWKVPVAQRIGVAPRVRQATVPGEAHNVAVLICVNQSYSMCIDAGFRGDLLALLHSGKKMPTATRPLGKNAFLTRMDMAAAAALALGDVLHALGIRFGVLGHTTRLDQFGTPVGSNRYRLVDARTRPLFLRFGDLQVEWVKDFAQRWPHRRRFIGGLYAQGNTYDGEVVRYAAHRLLAVPQVSRRVCIMLDDGEPVPDGDNKVLTLPHRAYLQQQVRRAADQGVEVLGVGMACDLSAYYPQHVRVDVLDQLPKVLLERLATLLRSAA